MRRRLSLLALAAAVMPLAAAAENFCPALAVPEALDLVCQVEADGATIVQGRDNPFAGFNQLRLQRLEEPVDDPEAWLRQAVTLDTSSISETLRGWMRHPDNPLKPEVVEPSLEALERTLGQLEALSDTVCEEPRQVGPARWAISCRFDVTVADGLLRLELRRTAAGPPVAIEMRTASDQRARQFEALLNGLDLAG